MALSAFVASPSLSASPIRVVNFCCYANLITCRHASTSPLLVQCWTTSISGAHNYVCNLGSGATQGRNVKVALVPRRGWLMRVRVVAPTRTRSLLEPHLWCESACRSDKGPIFSRSKPRHKRREKKTPSSSLSPPHKRQTINADHWASDRIHTLSELLSRGIDRERKSRDRANISHSTWLALHPSA